MEPVWPGVLISIDGVDGAGRLTQVDLLAVWLQQLGYGVLRTQWNSSKLVSKTIAEARRQDSLTPITYSILHAIDLAERVEAEIIPGLKAGFVILADRYTATALARDAARGVARDWLDNLFQFAVLPDLAIYLRIDADESISRIRGIGGEVSTAEAHESAAVRGALASFRQFQARVIEEYEVLTPALKLNPIDATLPIRTQQLQLRALIEPVLKAKAGLG